ncbi:MAG: hypothetical protein ABI147_04730 [Acidobacteriaceae bacterium]
MSSAISKCGWLCALLFASLPALTQTLPDPTVAAALNNLGARAGVVFAGEVTAVRHVGGVVEVQFRVDHNVKGAAAGGYMLREWAGLWAAGQRRYWVGECAFVFLHDAGKNGLSSAVDGGDGILPMLSASSAEPTVDIQRLRTRVLRAAGTAMVESGASMPLNEVAAAVLGEPSPPPIAPPIEDPIPLPIRRRPIRILPVRPVEPIDDLLREDAPQPLLRAHEPGNREHEPGNREQGTGNGESLLRAHRGNAEAEQPDAIR